MELRKGIFKKVSSRPSIPEVITRLPAVLAAVLSGVGCFEPLDNFYWVLENSPQPGLGSLYLWWCLVSRGTRGSREAYKVRQTYNHCNQYEPHFSISKRFHNKAFISIINWSFIGAIYLRDKCDWILNRKLHYPNDGDGVTKKTIVMAGKHELCTACIVYVSHICYLLFRNNNSHSNTNDHKNICVTLKHFDMLRFFVNCLPFL